MKINGASYRTIWLHPSDSAIVQIIDQRALPHSLKIEDIHSAREMIVAIKDMHLRGAPLIGVAAAYGLYLAARRIADGKEEGDIVRIAETLKEARPTAVNLGWAVDHMMLLLKKSRSAEERAMIALHAAEKMADEEVERCRLIGEHGTALIEALSRKKSGSAVNVLTHCNAGWLACIDWGTATSPVYHAAQKGIDVHVWVDETRPRNQGASLTAWELLENGIPHTIIADNTGGHLMQQGLVDCVIVGADRVTRCGDAANKIGTYLKALAAKDNGIPFYVAVPGSSFDFGIRNGSDIPIEERSEDEVKYIEGMTENGITRVLLTPALSRACNYGFDVTPARLITGIVTERGICEASEDSIIKLFPENDNIPV